jgi:hypothetical protein
MITRTLLFAFLLPLSALAQLQVFVLNGTSLTAVGSSFSVGTAALGDTIETQFRVRNTGNVDVPLVVSLSGDGFVIQCIPSPYVPPNAESAFCVDFTPAVLAKYSAILDVNGNSITLLGQAAAVATLTLSGSTTPLPYGATVGFGSVAVGASQPQAFLLSNSSNGTLTVNSVTVSGSGFSGPIGLTTPTQIGSGQSVPFQVKFTPQSGTPYQGTLTVDGRTFTLTGQGLAAPLPTATIVFASSVGASAQQNSITIPLSSASQVSGTGTLSMAFQPSVAGVPDDPAIEFLSGPLRKATVSIAVGATSATIGGQPSMAFQTGTTAGTITFTLTLENNAPQQSSLTIPPSLIILDTATAIRALGLVQVGSSGLDNTGSLSVAFSGFDNTQSASQLAFTFSDLKNRALPQGTINVETNALQLYFENNAAQFGGMFQLLATFPVTGDTTQIGFVTVQITNSAGSTPPQQIAFGN